jgi:hypothetical protein
MKEQARRVVQILIDHQCEAGIDIANGMAQVWFTKAGLDDHEYSLALEAAAENGWIIPAGGSSSPPHRGQISSWRAISARTSSSRLERASGLMV